MSKLGLLDLRELNRTEAVKSVLISLVLRASGAVEILSKLLIELQTEMRDYSGCRVAFALDRPSDGVQISPLFHTFRDFKKAGIGDGVLTEKNEIDVVLVWPERVALGLEIKWQSVITGLNEQLRQERKALQAIARYYGAKHTSMIAVLPRTQALARYPEADGLITTKRLSELAASIAGKEHLGTLIAEEIKTMVPEPARWMTTNLDGVRKFKPGAPSNSAFVGFMGGLPALRRQVANQLMERPHWKILETEGSKPPNARWIPLGVARRVIEDRLQVG